MLNIFYPKCPAHQSPQMSLISLLSCCFIFPVVDVWVLVCSMQGAWSCRLPLFAAGCCIVHFVCLDSLQLSGHSELLEDSRDISSLVKQSQT